MRPYRSLCADIICSNNEYLDKNRDGLSSAGGKAVFAYPPCSLAVPPGLWYSLRVKSIINQLLNTLKNRYTDDEDKFGQGLKKE
jgi:hypothetical protein